MHLIFWHSKSVNNLYLFLGLGLFIIPALAKSDYSNQPCPPNKISRNTPFDHSLFDTLLKKYVNDQGLVNYKLWKEKDLATLDTYLNSLSCVDADTWKDKNQKLAFYINAYNAITIRGMLGFYPTKSIKEHAKFFGFNIWKDYKTYIGNKEYSLDDIEHKILRKMGKPGIHFALVCASLGCPKLRNEVYQPDILNQQLEDQAKTFFNNPQQFKVDTTGDMVYFSSILNWYGEDFGNSNASKIAFAKKYLSDESVKQFLDKPGLKVFYLDYDWNINEQK